MTRKLTDMQIQEAVARRHAGERIKTIGQLLGVSMYVIRRVTAPYAPPGGWTNPARESRFSNEEKTQIVARRMAGDNVSSIACDYGVGVSVIYKICNNHVARAANDVLPVEVIKKKTSLTLSAHLKRRMYALAGNMSYAKVAQECGVSIYVASHYLRQVRPADGWNRHSPLSRLTEAQIVEVCHLRESGMTLREIAARYDVSAPVVHRLVKHIKVRPVQRKGKLTPQQKADAVACRLRGETLKSIALRLNVSIPYVGKITRHAKPVGGWPRKFEKP